MSKAQAFKDRYTKDVKDTSKEAKKSGESPRFAMKKKVNMKKLYRKAKQAERKQDRQDKREYNKETRDTRKEKRQQMREGGADRKSMRKEMRGYNKSRREGRDSALAKKKDSRYRYTITNK